MGIEEAVEKLSKSKILGCDTETTGLKFLDDTLLMLQIFDGTDNYVIDCRSIDILPLNKIFESKEIIKIFHNAKFDIKFLRANGINIENVYDTMLVEKIIHCGKINFKVALKSLMHRYFGIEMEKETRNTFINHKGDFTKAQVIYGLDDTVKLLEIRNLQLDQVKELQLEAVVKLENSVTIVFADIEFNGLYLDKPTWEAASIQVEKDIDMIFEELEEELHKDFPQYRDNQVDMFGGGRLNTINWDSPTQVLKLMQNFEPGLDSAGGPALQPIKDKHPIISKYVEYKEKTKLFNSYGLDFYKYLQSDGKVHTNFDQILNTGRVSSRGPNMQQIPANNTYRNAFGTGDPDYVYVSSDFSAQELCIIAVGSQDPVWLKVLSEGGDLHGVCAAEVMGHQWIVLGKTNEERKNTPEGHKLRTHIKIVNFGLAYGMSAYSLSKSLRITEGEAKDLIAKYYKAFPKIQGFLKRLGDYGKKHGNIRTYAPFRRIRHFDNWQGPSTPRSDMAKIMRASMNTPIQGSGADMCKLSLIMLFNVIKENNYPVQIVLTVHDEINCICKREFAKEFSHILTATMEKAATYIVGEGLLKCDATISEKWEK